MKTEASKARGQKGSGKTRGPNRDGAAKASCHLCERGFPSEDGVHYGTQSLGMIPSTPCKHKPKSSARPKRDTARVKRRPTEEVLSAWLLRLGTLSPEVTELVTTLGLAVAERNMARAIANGGYGRTDGGDDVEARCDALKEKLSQIRSGIDELLDERLSATVSEHLRDLVDIIDG